MTSQYCDHVVNGDSNLILNGGFEGCQVRGQSCPNKEWEYDAGSTSSTTTTSSSSYYTADHCRTSAPCTSLGSTANYSGFKQSVKNLVAGGQYILKFWATSDDQLPNGIQILIDGALTFNITNYATGGKSCRACLARGTHALPP